jgi:hypothetical protein
MLNRTHVISLLIFLILVSITDIFSNGVKISEENRSEREMQECEKLASEYGFLYKRTEYFGIEVVATVRDNIDGTISIEAEPTNGFTTDRNGLSMRIGENPLWVVNKNSCVVRKMMERVG